MAIPTAAIGAVGIGSSLIGGIIGARGAAESASAQATASTYKAGVALLNRQINLQNANWALESGEVQGMESGLRARSQIGQTKVVQAASSLDVNSGTAKAVRDTQTDVASYDQNVIKFDAAKTAYGYESKATMDEAQSHLDTMAADTELEAGKINMLTSFINAGSSVSSKWMQGKQAGMWG